MIRTSVLQRHSGSAARSRSAQTCPGCCTSDARDMLTGLHGLDEIRRGFGLLTEVFGRRLASVIVQPAAADGVEAMISVLHEQVADGPFKTYQDL